MKRYWLAALLPLLLLLWWVLDRGGSQTVIHFAKVQQATIESTVSTNGKVEPEDWAAARAETPGVVQNVAVQRGQQVAAGETLVTLDTTGAQSELAAALAQQEEAVAESGTLGQGGKASTVASLDDSIASARAAVDVTQRNYDSLNRLAGEQAATKLQVEAAKDALNRARLALSAAQDQKRTLVTQGDQSVAQAKLAGARAAVAAARRRVNLARIVAPTSGTLYQFDLKVGAYLQAGDLAGLVGKLDRVKVIVYVDEPDLGRVGLNMPVSITWDARPGRKWWGRVDKLPTEVIALGSRAVGEVTTIVDNPDHDLLPGVTVNALVISKVAKEAISIPKAALHTIRGTNGVYKLSGDHLLWTPVATGASDVNNVQIVSGLQLGDLVADRVIEPSDAEITDGMRVKAIFN